MSRVLSTIPNPKPAEARLIGFIELVFGQKLQLPEEDILSIQEEYQRRRAAGQKMGPNIKRDVEHIAAALGIAFTNHKQAEHIASLISFQNMGAAQKRLFNCRQIQLTQVENLTNSALDADDDLSDAAPDTEGYEVRYYD